MIVKGTGHAFVPFVVGMQLVGLRMGKEPMVFGQCGQKARELGQVDDGHRPYLPSLTNGLQVAVEEKTAFVLVFF